MAQAAVLGVDGRVILVIAVVSTLIGHLNHSNVNISWGPLRYVLNSPRMHIWHHDRDWPADRRFGVNFAVCFSAQQPFSAVPRDPSLTQSFTCR